MNLIIRRINNEAIMPEYAHDGDAGLDLFSVENVNIDPGEYKLIKTGIQLELPKFTEAQIRPRSGLALKHGITVLNTPGTIDEGYRGEIGIILINHGKNVFKVEKGMKIAQMVINKVEHVKIVEKDTLTETERNIGGFGSTGVK